MRCNFRGESTSLLVTKYASTTKIPVKKTKKPAKVVSVQSKLEEKDPVMAVQRTLLLRTPMSKLRKHMEYLLSFVLSSVLSLCLGLPIFLTWFDMLFPDSANNFYNSNLLVFIRTMPMLVTLRPSSNILFNDDDLMVD